jgi:hypothetical protein
VQFDLNQKGDKAHNDGMTHRKPESSFYHPTVIKHQVDCSGSYSPQHRNDFISFCSLLCRGTTRGCYARAQTGRPQRRTGLIETIEKVEYSPTKR